MKQGISPTVAIAIIVVVVIIIGVIGYFTVAKKKGTGANQQVQPDDMKAMMKKGQDAAKKADSGEGGYVPPPAPPGD